MFKRKRNAYVEIKWDLYDIDGERKPNDLVVCVETKKYFSNIYLEYSRENAENLVKALIKAQINKSKTLRLEICKFGGVQFLNVPNWAYRKLEDELCRIFDISSWMSKHEVLQEIEDDKNKDENEDTIELEDIIEFEFNEDD